MSEKSRLDYFNLDSRARAAQEQATAVISPAHISIIRQIVMYMGVFVGILFSAAVSQLQSEEAITMAVNAGRIIVFCNCCIHDSPTSIPKAESRVAIYCSVWDIRSEQSLLECRH